MITAVAEGGRGIEKAIGDITSIHDSGVTASDGAAVATDGVLGAVRVHWRKMSHHAKMSFLSTHR